MCFPKGHVLTGRAGSRPAGEETIPVKAVEEEVSYVVGIDVGGTNTYGVLLKNNTVLTTAQAATEHEDLHRGPRRCLPRS